MISLAIALTALTLNANPAAPAPAKIVVDPPHVRQAVERGLVYMDKNKFNYGCVSCHDGPWMIWSYHEAEKRGFNVNRKALDLIQARAVKGYAGHADLKPAPMDGFRDLSTNVLYLTPALTASSHIDAETTALLDKITAHLLKKQKDDGHWVIHHMGSKDKWDKAYHDLINDQGDEYNAPIIDRNDVTTMWAVLALTAREPSAALKDAVAKSRDKARKWLKESPSSGSLQAAMLRVLVAKRLGTAEELRTAVKDLSGRQNGNGGWSQESDLPSDALGTGQALFALTNAGLTANDPAIKKAWSFLLDSQDPDGDWHVFARKRYRKKGKTDPSEAPSYMGTAWAVLGLVRSLPPDPNEKDARGQRMSLDMNQRAAQKSQSLDLYGTAVSDRDLKDVSGFADVQTLNLGHTKITDAGLRELAQLKQLQSLNLGYNSAVTASGLKALAGLPQLTALDFTFSPAMTDARLKELAHLPQLRMLNLEGTPVTDAGLKELARLPQLQELNLESTAVTDAGLKTLGELKQLKVIRLQGSKASHQGKQSLRKAIPGLKILEQ